ncbi:MAG: CoA-binding protein [Deltaproteobacteria bacterium]|nr:CoA-binding protein [Deltaproteobacteria bacterium]
MIQNAADHPLHRMVNPRSVALFGASNNFASMGTSILHSLLHMGYEGRVYPVHRTEETVQGLTAYKRVEDLPEAPDLAVIVLPTRVVAETLEACGKKGIRSAVVVTAGFREVGEEGAAREAELVRIAEKYGVRFIGPNCIGVTNPHAKLNTTFLPFEARPGFVGMASQSGSFVTQMFDYLDQYGMGFSSAFSVGNSADTDLVDCLEYLAAEEHTKVIALYMEGIPRGREFLSLAREVVQKKPVVALYVGGSEAGRRASLSHTGTLAGPDRLYSGVFRQAGVIRAKNVTELFDFCWALGSAPVPRGNRVAIQTHSGGPGAAAADACSRNGLAVPPLSPESLEKLAPLVPPTASVNNPVDVTFSKNPQDFFDKLPDILLSDPGVDMCLCYCLVPDDMAARHIRSLGLSPEEAAEKSREWAAAMADAVADTAAKHEKPFFGFTFRRLSEVFCQRLIARGVPVFPGPERAVRAMWALCEYHRLREKILSSGR